MKKILTLSFVAFLFVACETEITNFKVNYQGKSLVVYGEVSNLAGPYTVRITRVSAYSPYDISQFVGDPVQGATVKIVDNANNIVTLIESRPGFYQTPLWFKGVVGQKYQLKIKTSDNFEIESTLDELKAAPIFGEFSSAFEDAEKVEDMRFKLKANIADPKETEDYYFVKKQDFIQFLTTCPEPPPPPAPSPPCYIKCWRAPLNTQPILTSDFLMNGKNIPLPVGNITLEDFTKWTVQLDAFSVSKIIYEYWKRQEEQRLIGGGLFDKVPAQIVGNLTCTSNPEIQMLGIFVVAGANKQRVTIDRFTDVSLEVYKKIQIYADFHDIRYKNYPLWDCKQAGFIDYNIGYDVPELLAAF